MQIRVYRGEAVSNGALAAPELPARLKVLPWGESQSTKGRVVVGGLTLAVLSAEQRTAGFERVALDFEHNTVPGTRAYTEAGEPRPVAAYGTVEVIEGQGLFLTGLVWTPEGIRAARNFEDLSPAVRQNAAGEVLFVHSVALTRNGAVHDLQFYSVATEIETQNQQETSMKEWMLKLLGLNAEATDEEISTAAEAMAPALLVLSALDEQARAALPKLLLLDASKLTGLCALSAEDLQAKLTVLSAVGDSSKATIEGLVSRLSLVEGQVQTFSVEKTKSERQLILDRAGREGKVIPLSAEQIAAMDLTILSTLCEKLPATVPVNQRTVEDVRTHSAGTQGRNNPNRPAIAAAFGMKPEDLD